RGTARSPGPSGAAGRCRPAAWAGARAWPPRTGTARFRPPRRPRWRAGRYRPAPGSPGSPDRVVAMLGHLRQAGRRRVRHGAAVRARREDLTGQHPGIDAGDLPHAADVPAQGPAPGVVVALLDEDHEVDGPADEHV